MVWKFNNGDQTVCITKYSNTENARTSTTDSLASFVNVADRLTNGTLSSQRHIVPPQRCEYSHSTNTCHSFQENYTPCLYIKLPTSTDNYASFSPSLSCTCFVTRSLSRIKSEILYQHKPTNTDSAGLSWPHAWIGSHDMAKEGSHLDNEISPI